MISIKIKVTATVITTTGAKLIRKSLKSKCVADPIITFGGFPIISAVPPTLHINISEIKIGTGDMRSMRQREIVIGAISNAAVTESISAAPTAVTIESKTKSSRGCPLDFFNAQRANTWKNPDFFTTEIKIIIPANNPKVLKSINSVIASS